MERQRTSAISTLLLLLAALIWGVAFVAQSIGADYVGAFTFLALRSWLGVVSLLPVIALRRRKKAGHAAMETGETEGERMLRHPLAVGGICTGVFLFAASAAQQVGIAMTTAGKSGFITAMYVVMVPVISVFIGRRPPRKIWLCVVLSIAGLYLLCVRGGLSVGAGDLLTLLCALLFAFQILAIGYFVRFTDGVELTCAEFLTEAVLATLCMLMFERGTATDALVAALPAILYTGVLSSGVGYTLQTLGEREVSPPVASLAMCMESVFSALFGWMILREALSVRELAGCALMIVSILLAELPVERLSGKKEVPV